MKFFTLIAVGFLMTAALALTEKKPEPPPVEEKIENTKEVSKLRTLEMNTPVVLHHREPVHLPDGKIVEVYFFSHKNVKVEDLRRAVVGLKIRKDSEVEILSLTQDIDKRGREKLSTGKIAGYSIKLLKMVYDESITVEISAE